MKGEFGFEDTIEDNLDKVIALAKSKSGKRDEMSIEREKNKADNETNNIMDEEIETRKPADVLEAIAGSVDQLFDSDEVLLFLLQYLKESTISLILKFNTNVTLLI